MVNIREVCDDFFKEIQSGKVETKEAIYNIRIDINKLQNDEMIPTLKIRNKEQLISKIEKYLRKVIDFRNVEDDLTQDFIKNSLVHLFANATFTDFENPEMFIDKYISFMDMPLLNTTIVPGIFDNVINNQDIAYGSELDCEIVKQSEFFETPYAFKSKIKQGNLEYRLPVISFGVANDTCYIYAIQKEKEKYISKEREVYNKRIKRLLYKLDDKVSDYESKEYLEYKEGISDYYPENITDVVPSAILALSLFFQNLYQNNITNISVVSFLPVRYNAKKDALESKVRYNAKTKNLSNEEIKVMLKDAEQEHLRIQNNLTQKLIRNFMRLNHHFNNIEIIGYPFEESEYLNIRVNPFVNTDNAILKRVIENDCSKQK